MSKIYFCFEQDKVQRISDFFLGGLGYLDPAHLSLYNSSTLVDVGEETEGELGTVTCQDELERKDKFSKTRSSGGGWSHARGQE